MTTPGGSSGADGNINLATLWIPVVPDTSKIGDAMRHAGEEGRRQFEESFTGGGSSAMFDKLTSQLSSQFSSQISQGLQRGLAGMELPGGLNRVTDSLMRGFEGVRGRTESAENALREYQRTHERLVEALDREAIAEQRLSELRQRGAQGSQMMSAVAGLEAAHRRTAQATTDDAEAHQQFQKTLDSGSSSLVSFAASTGIVSGAISAGITLGAQAISKMIEAAVEGFKDIVEGAENVAKEIVDVGEKFEDLHRSIELSTVASGSALDELKVHSDALVSSLDTGFDKVGTDMATFATRLGMQASPALDKLTHDVEELRDRFGSLDASALAGVFTQFEVSGDHADQALASLVHTAREFGVGLNQLVNDLASAGPTLQEFNLSVEQSGHLLGELEAKHINAATAVNALGKAEKAAADQHKDLKTFVQDEITTIEAYQAANNTAAAEQESLLAFGNKNWIQSTAAAKAYLETLNAGPNAYKGNTAEMQHLIAATQSLENRWEALRNKMTVAFAPLASVALDGISKALDNLGGWINAHEDQVLGFVRRIGEDFIHALPTIKLFAEGVLDTLKPVAEVIQWVAKVSTEALGGLLMTLGKLGSIPWFKAVLGDLPKGLTEVGVAVYKAGQALGDADLGGILGRASDAIHGFRIDTQGMTEDLDKSTDALKRQLDALNNEKSAVGDAGGSIGHIAPPASTFTGQPPDDSASGADPGGGGSEGGQPGSGDEPPADGGATPVQPRSWTPAAPPNNGVGGPQHVRMAGWHSGVEQTDWTGGRRDRGDAGGHSGGGHHDGGGHRGQRTGPTPEQDRQHTRRLEDLNDNISDYGDSITDLTQQQKDASGKLQHDKALRDSYQQGSLTWIEENKAVIADQKEYAKATKELTRALRDRKRAEEDLGDENAKYADEQKKGRGGGGGDSSGGDSNARNLGQGLLSGVMGDLGLGNVFGKSPLDWGLTKLFTGGLDWGLNALNTMADAGALGGRAGGAGGGGAGGGAGGVGAGGGGASPFIFGDRGTPPGPHGERVTLPGGSAAATPATPATPGSAQHPTAPAAPGDSIIPPAIAAPTPVPIPHMAAPPGTHFSGYEGGGADSSTSGGAPAHDIWRASMNYGGSGGVQTAGYTAAAAPHIAQLASAAGVPLTHNPDGSVSSSNPVWAHLLQRESGGRNIRQGIKDANSGGNEAEGYFQITPGTWRSHGGAEFAPNPMAATAEQQAQIAARILQSNPSGSDWGAGGPGRENAAELLAGLGGAPAADGGAAPYTPAGFPPAAIPGAAGDPMAQRWAAAMQRGAIGPHGELAPGTAAGSEAGLQQNTIRGRRLISALFPELQNIGGVRQDSLKWHPQGLALDLMIPGQGGLNDPTTPAGRALGDQINQFIHQNAGALGSDYTMWQQADHYNHVHANFAASGYPNDPNEQYFVPQGLNPGVGGAQTAPAGFHSAAMVPGGPTPSAVGDVPDVNSITGQPHYTGPTLPGPAPRSVSSGDNVQQSPIKQSAQNAMSGIGGLIAALQADWDPRQWQGILREPEWSGVQHQHQPVQSVQPVNYDHSVTINNPTVANPDALTQAMRQEQLSRFYTAAGGLPAPSVGSP